MSGNSEQILSDIQSLQQMEQELFQSLEANPNITVEEREKIVQKMNELSNMRINLYKTLSNLNTYYGSALKSSVSSLKEQVLAVGVVETELNKAKKNLEMLEAEKNNKIRMVEINTYYGDKYSEHAQLMKLIIYTLIPVIIVVYLYNIYLIPTEIKNVLIVIIATIGGYYFWMRYTSIIMRDNMNYQQYDWFFDASKAPVKAVSTVTGDPWASPDMGTCIGDACCSNGLIYDSAINQCVVPGFESKSSSTSNNEQKSGRNMNSINTANKHNVDTSISTSASKNSTTNIPFTESMISGVLTKTQPGKFKADVDLRQLSAFNA